MSANNVVMLVGNIGGKVRGEDDINLSYLPSGAAVAKFSLAVESPKKNGEKQEPFWFDVSVYGKSAENLRQYCGKGDKLIVQGHLRPYKFQGQDGKTVKGLSVECEDWKILVSKGDGQQYGGGEYSDEPAAEQPPSTIPF